MTMILPRSFAVTTLLILVSSLYAADIDPYPPLPILGPVLYRCSFEEGVGGWKALHDCKLSNDSGVLKIMSTGDDPYAMAQLPTPVPGPLMAKIKMRSTTGGGGQFFWASDRHPGTAAERCSSFDMIHGNQWHEYSTLLDVEGALTHLRLDPGSRKGTADVAWIELQQARHFPILIDALQTTLTAIKVRLRNCADRPIEVRLAGKSTAIAPATIAEMVQPLQGSAAIEAVSLAIEIQDFPPLKRTVVVHRPVQAKDWPSLKCDALTLRVASDGTSARLERSNQLVAVIAPLALAGNSIVRFRSIEREDNRLRLSGEGIEATLTLVGDQVELSLSASKPIEGPVVRPLGSLQQGLFAGLEYLGRGEQSSSTLDIETEEHLRFRPDPLKVTMPLMACVTDRASVAVSWNDMSLQPTYACPNFVDGVRDEHRMSLSGRKIEAVVRVSSGDLEDAILWAVRRHGLPPLPSAPRDAETQRRLCLSAIRGPIAGPGGLGHCAEPKFNRQPLADVVSALWRLSGEVPSLETIVPGGGHVRNDAIYFVSNRGELWLSQRRAEIHQLLKAQQPDGSFRYQGKYQRGHDEDTASGWCAFRALRLLEFAYVSGDTEALAAGLKTLEYMKRFREPRGSQTWELSLHTPDVLASAQLVWAYVRGYELTGRAEYLTCARRWALTGIPFVYLWQCYPIMLYTTPPVYGATSFRAPNWMGLPVQWCGGVYAYALAMLSAYDHTLDWKHLAQGIYVAAQQIQYPEGPLAGCLPDVFHLATQERAGPSINPSAVFALQTILEGKVDSLAVAADSKHRVAAPYPLTIQGDRVRVQATPGMDYQVLVDGKVRIIRASNGEDLIDLR